MRGSTDLAETVRRNRVQGVDAGVGLLADVALLLREIRDRLEFGERESVVFGAELVEIAADAPTEWQYEGSHFASVAIYNPTGDTLYVGLGAGTGISGREMAVVPGGCSLCLPLRAQRLSLGLGSSSGAVYVFPFQIAQPYSFTTVEFEIDGGGP